MRYWLFALALPVSALAQMDHDHSGDVPWGSAPLAAPGAKRAEQIYDLYRDQIGERADRYYHNGEYWNVISMLQLLLGIEPADNQANADLVFYLRSVGRYDLALTQAIRFKQENPADKLAAETEAEIYHVERLWDRIPRLLEPHLETTRSRRVFVLLMRSYEEMGLIKEAIRVVEARLESFPDDGAAKSNLNRLNEKLKGGHLRDEQATDHGARNREKGILVLAERLQHGRSPRVS